MHRRTGDGDVLVFGSTVTMMAVMVMLSVVVVMMMMVVSVLMVRLGIARRQGADTADGSPVARGAAQAGVDYGFGCLRADSCTRHLREKIYRIYFGEGDDVVMLRLFFHGFERGKRERDAEDV